MSGNQAARELLKLARLIVAGRVPSAVRRRLDAYMEKQFRKCGQRIEDYYEDRDDIFDDVQDFLFNDPDAPEDEDGEIDLDVIDDWTDELVDEWVKKAGVEG